MSILEPGQYDMMRDIQRLSRENNDMLHAMRRQSFIGGVLKVIMYLIFLGAPVWLYYTYFKQPIDTMVTVYQGVATSTAQAQNTFAGFADMMRQVQNILQDASTTIHKIPSIQKP